MSNAAAAVPRTALKLGRVLAPVDFSDNCRRAAHDAEWLARRFGAELVLLHSVPRIEIPLGPAEAFAYASVPDVDVDRLSESAADLEAFAIDVHGLTTRRVVVEDDPAHAILEYIRERHCDLIVMPTHGYGALHRLVAGSVTSQVLRGATCPVWTGCHFERGPEPASVRTVLCAVDFSHDPAGVAQWAVSFAREFAATLHLTHVLPESAVRAAGMYFDPDWRSDIAHEARRRMSELLCETSSLGRTHVPAGDVPAAIAEVATEVGADLVVVGRGPKTYDIIRAVGRAVVAV
jgi:nucleotide-binding universal stress UspA family protein